MASPNEKENLTLTTPPKGSAEELAQDERSTLFKKQTEFVGSSEEDSTLGELHEDGSSSEGAELLPSRLRRRPRHTISADSPRIEPKGRKPSTKHNFVRDVGRPLMSFAQDAEPATTSAASSATVAASSSTCANDLPGGADHGPVHREAQGSGLSHGGGSCNAALPASAGREKGFKRLALLDGSKLILQLGLGDSFAVDAPSKILLCSSKIKIERPVAWQAVGKCVEGENAVVIDTGVNGHRFYPIPLAYYGTIYTKDGTVHVTVGTNVRKSKISSRGLPYRTCNKFSVNLMLETDEEGFSGPGSSKYFERLSTSRTLEYLNPKQAMRLVKHLAEDPHSGVVYIRADDSLIRYKLKKDEKLTLHAGKVVAWTYGVRFEQKRFCWCWSVTTAVFGEGTVWVCNPAPKML